MKKLYSKKLLAMLSALSMTVGIFAAVPASADTQSILNENFDGTTYAPNRKVNVSYDDTKNAAYGKAAHFQTAGADNATDRTDRQIGHDFGTVQNGGKVIYSFDINAEAFNTTVASGNFIDFTVFSDAPNTNWNNQAAYILRIGNPWKNENAYALPVTPNSSTISGTSRILTKSQWYRVDLIFDLDNSTISYYLDGADWYSQDLKNTSNENIKSLGGIRLGINNLYHNTSVFIDNINIRKVDSDKGDMKIESSSFNNDENYVDVKFSETIKDSTDDLATMIRVNNAKNNSAINIDSVTKLTADTIRISFADNALSAASEYKVALNGIQNPFGGSVTDSVTFNTPSTKNKSVVEDFDTFDVSTKTTKFGKIYDNTTDSAKTTYELVDGRSGESSDKAVHIHKPKGTSQYPSFRLNISNASTELATLDGRKLGKLSYEFDFKTPESTDGTNIDMQLTLEGSSNISPINVAGKSSAVYRSWGTNNADNNWGKLSGFSKNTWNNIKVEFDYLNNKISYYLNNSKIKEYDYDLASAPTWYRGYLACSSSDANSCVDYTIDNFKISYEETATQGIGEDNTIGIKDFAVVKSENGYTVSGTGVNTYAAEKKITVIVCGYDSNGVLTYVDCDPEVSLGELRTTAINKTYETGDASITKFKAFAWENTTGMTPCVMPAQYPNN